MKIAIAVVVVLVLVAAAGLTALAWRASARAIHPGAPAYAWSLADYPELKPQDVRVETSTGATLGGRFFPGAKHGETLAPGGPATSERVTEFFTRALT